MNSIQEITVQKNVPATMRDGATLYANVYRPGGAAGGGEYPVLLTRLPYGKELPLGTGYVNPVKLAENGYIVVVQDVRGRFASEGDWNPSVYEFEDGYDTVEWAARLPGSDGRVGMYGVSYFGMTQWQAAVMQPPALVSLAPGITYGNYLNGAQFRGGVRELGLRFYWSEAILAPDTLVRRYRESPEELQKQLPALVNVIDNIPGKYDTLPLEDLPDPGGVVPYMFTALDYNVDADVWNYLNIDGRYEQVEVPTFHIGGWYDIFIGETLRQYAAMKEQATHKGLTLPRLLVGPWSHGRFESTVGELDFGFATSGLFLNYKGDLADYHLRWFEATVKGNEKALDGQPPVEVFVMGENRWRAYEEWPVPGSREERWYFHSANGANTRAGDGALSREEPGEEPEDAYDYDPENPVPTLGGALLMPPVYRPGARDQAPNEERPDVLCYTSDALESGYTVLGAVYVTLYAASSAPDTDFVARLVDVYPDGRAIGIADGIIRASARESYPEPGVVEPTKPSLIEPERVYEYTIDLWATGITFLAGHRIRAEVTSSSFPRWDRNLNTGEDTAHSSYTEVARQRVLHDDDHPSHIALTVVDD